jgi:hypothetical protein
MTIVALSTIVSFILIIGGLIAIILPFAPSIPTVWLGIFLYAVSHGYVTVDQRFLMTVSIIALSTIVLDYTLSRSGIKKLRAGGWGIFGAVLGGLFGMLFSPVATYLVGPIIGAIVLELLVGRDQVYSFKSGNYTIIAFMGGTVVKLVASIAMIGLFILRLRGNF